MNDHQRLALDQLNDIADADPSFKVGDVVERSAGAITVDVSLDTAAIVRGPGVRLRAREPFRIWIDPGFPYAYPTVWALHLRWAGTPHVHWGIQLCLYAAPTLEWNPSDGMFGLVDRLWAWLTSAAAGELDPADAPLHPPVNYGRDRSMPQIIVRANAPVAAGEVFLGVASLDRPAVERGRGDVVGFTSFRELDQWPEHYALCVVMPGAFDWEYPETVAHLFRILERQGLDGELVKDVLGIGASRLAAGLPLITLIGTPMRRIDGETLIHFVAWGVAPAQARLLRAQLLRDADDDETRLVGQLAGGLVADWAKDTSISWCRLREDRPEVTRPREQGSPLEYFRGKRVVVWGCGALGAPVAEAIARVRPAKLRVYDFDDVSPGVLVRQPFADADIGLSKAHQTAARLGSALPALDIDSRYENVITGPLARDDWDDGADVVIDATASPAVAARLERTRRLAPGRAAVVSMAFGHDATRGMTTVTPATLRAGPHDLARKARIALRTKAGQGTRPSGYRAFSEEFWPSEARTRPFQPEPGCSEPTFTGSQAETQALAQAMLLHAARRLASGDEAGAALFTTLPHVDAQSQPQPRDLTLAFADGVVLEDGIQGYEVRLAPAALADIEGYIRRNDRLLDAGYETGGLLFGQRDDAAGVVWVSEVIGPPPDSRSSPDEFVCGIEGVDRHRAERRERGRGSLAFVGTWHTHPDGRALPSVKDVCGMSRIVLDDERPIPRSLLLIVGGRRGARELAQYMFHRRDLKPPFVIVAAARRTRVPAPPPPQRNVGLALSGGGFRALAFHLGCLRALEDRGVLERVSVVSGVSGGSLAAALWAYSDGDFGDFDRRTVDLLRSGLQLEIAARALASPRALQTIASLSTSGVVAAAARLVAAADAALARLPHVDRQQRVIVPPLRRFSSATEASVDVFDRLFGGRPLASTGRDVDVVLNACDLRTGSAFRFGSRESHCYRYGRVAGDVSVGFAVAASAAYPLLLPALDREFEFVRRDGSHSAARVVLADGGVFDNLGTSVLEPGRDPNVTVVYDPEYIIACDAGRGLLDDRYLPYGFVSRMRRSFESTFRKAQDGARNRLHLYAASGQLKGFVFPYLGQFERELPLVPVDLPLRSDVVDYPTDLSAMSATTIELLAARGEKLTRLLVSHYCPEL